MATINGTAGNDTLTGTSAADTISGLAGNDILNGGDGNDILIGGAGADALFGGNGTDTASYSNATVAIAFNFATGIHTGDAAGDSFNNIERIQGTTLNDTYVAGAGVDFFDGAAGTDALSYATSDAAVNVNTSLQTGTGGYAQGDSFRNVERVIGSAFDDVFTSSFSTLEGGDGDDTYIVPLAAVIVEAAGGGNDLVIATGSSYTLGANLERLSYNGTAAFTGTGNADANIITGATAADTLSGLAGDDTLIGGLGNDILHGGAGADVFDGGGGTDTASYATAGSGVVVDLASGATSTGDAVGDSFIGIELFVGSGFNDTFVSGAGADNLNGAVGTDTVSYAASTAAVNVNLTNGAVSGGYAQGDVLTSIERVVGSAFNDTLTSSTSGHTLEGGAGDDLYIWNGGATIVEAAGGGIDTVQTTATIVTLQANVERLVYLGSAAFNGNGNGENNEIIGGSGVDTLLGNGGDDTLNGADGDDVLIGGAGADHLVGGAGTDTARYMNAVTINLATGVHSGDAAGDTFDSIEILQGSASDDKFVSGAGADRLDGNGGYDTLSYAASTSAVNVNITTNVASGGYAQGDVILGFDRLEGSAFNDVLGAGVTGHQLAGGDGDDLYIITNNGIIIEETSGGGIDTAQVSVNRYNLSTTDYVENLIYTGTAIFTGTGSDAANVITGGTNNDILDGGAGDDTLNGGDGNDSLTGGAGADHLVGGAGTDTARYVNTVTINTATGVHTGDAADDTFDGVEILQGSTFADTFVSGAGADRFDGNSGTDTISYAASTAAVNVNLTTGVASGGYADGDVISNFEKLIGSAGDDTLGSSTAGHTLAGGAGNDTYVIGNASVIIQEDVGGGIDTVATTLATYSMTGLTNVENLTFVGTGAFSGLGDGGNNVITGGDGADSLQGGAGDDTLNGGVGADSLQGGDGDDTLNGGDGDDSLFGGAGADHLVGGAGLDTARYLNAITIDMLTGNHLGDAAGDTFDVESIQGSNASDVFIAGVGADNFQGGGGVDILDYSASTAGVNVNLTTGVASGGYAAGDVVTGFETVIGTAYGDTLASSTSGHRLEGGDGNDTYVIGATGISLVDGSGDDTIQTTLSTFSLASLPQIERLTYVGGSNFVGAGNNLDNVIIGGVTNDILTGGFGADTLIGGGGFDTANYADSTTSVIINLSGAAPTVTGIGAGDTFDSIEKFIATSYTDMIFAGSGADNVDAGTGIDLVSYRFSSAGITLQLASPGSNGGDAIGDVFTGAEIYEGSAFNDVLYGDTATNIFIGGAGADTIDGAGGVDSIWYLTSTAAVTVDLAAHAGTGGDAEGDTITGIENVLGTLYDDTITGDAAANKLEGGAGNDTIYGGDGDDVIYGAWITDTGPLGTANPGPQADMLSGGAGNDTITTNYLFSPLLDAGSIVHGDAGNDTINVGSATAYGDDGNDTITGAQGYKIFGGAGNDVLVLNGIGEAEGGDGSDVYQVYTTAIVEMQDLGTTGTDQVRLFNVASFADMAAKRVGDDLFVTNASDAADGTYDSGIKVVGYFAGPSPMIELFYTADGGSFSIPI